MTDEATWGPGLRWTRAAWLSSCAVMVAAGGHLAAGGTLPGPAVTLALTALLAWPLSLALGRVASPGRLLALLLAAQWTAHVGFSISRWFGEAAALPAHAATVPTHHGVVLVTTPAGHQMDGSLSDLLPEAALGGSGMMILAHLAGAGVMWCWLSRTERGLQTLLRLAVRPVRAILRPLVSAVLVVAAPLLSAGNSRPEPIDGNLGPAPLHVLARRLVTRRGPPSHLTA